MKRVIQLLNRLVSEGVVRQYAIGGAVGAFYYIEPTLTEDLDVFVDLGKALSDLAPLSDLHRTLSELGYMPERDAVRIDNYPVQFLPVFNALIAEAVELAATVEIQREPMRVMTAEHLVAIMLDTGRTKDFLRISMFIEQQAINLSQLIAILERHSLTDKWEKNQFRFLP